MSSEAVVQRAIWLAKSAVSVLFRVNTGTAWLSNNGPGGVRRLTDGSVHIIAPRSIALGFGLTSGKPVNGAADLVGWTSVEITADMVGKKIAVYTSIETKRTNGGKTSQEQENWRDQILAAGGIAGIANSVESADWIYQEWYDRFKS